MKASNPVIMVQAYRLLVAEMNVLGWDYPLHLGVTEAGEGEDGRMKSAIGIGTLLMVCPLPPVAQNYLMQTFIVIFLTLMINFDIAGRSR